MLEEMELRARFKEIDRKIRLASMPEAESEATAPTNLNDLISGQFLFSFFDMGFDIGFF